MGIRMGMMTFFKKTAWPIQLRGCYPEGPCVFIAIYNNNKNICVEIFTIIIDYDL